MGQTSDLEHRAPPPYNCPWRQQHG